MLLSGRQAVIKPAQTDFGNVAIGSSASQAVAIANDGDALLPLEGLFMVTGTSSVFPLTADSCSGQGMNPGSSCQFTISFQPNANGYREATMVLFANTRRALTPVGFSGTGVPTLDGAATITGHAAAGSTLTTCNPFGFPAGTTYAYQWLGNGQPLGVVNSVQTFALLDANVAQRLACRILATNSVLPFLPARRRPTSRLARVATNQIVVLDNLREVTFSFLDMLNYHGGGSPGGVAHAFKVLERGLPLLDLGGRVERREIVIETAFGGPGARDAFELVTRAVTEQRFILDPSLTRPAFGRARERFVFRLRYRERAVTLTLREGFVTEQFIDLTRRENRTADEEHRLAAMKAEMAALVMAAAAVDVYDVASAA